MKYCSILFFIELTLELIISFILKIVNYPSLFENGLIFRSWLLIVIYKVPIFFIFAFFLWVVNTQSNIRGQALSYFISSLISYIIIQKIIFRDAFFTFNFLGHPTYGIMERLLLISLVLFISVLTIVKVGDAK